MGFSRTLRPMTAAEKETLLQHLNPQSKGLGRLLATIFKSGEVAAGKERLEADCREGTAEVLTLEVERYASGQETNDEGPICFFELGQNQLLVLWGQWLCDPHVVTTASLDIDELWERNAWFKHFRLVRAPASGIVLSLQPSGRETVSSVGTVGAGRRLPAQPSEVFQGSLDALLSENQ